jgi:hypothetical protein
LVYTPSYIYTRKVKAEWLCKSFCLWLPGSTFVCEIHILQADLGALFAFIRLFADEHTDSCLTFWFVLKADEQQYQAVLLQSQSTLMYTWLDRLRGVNSYASVEKGLPEYFLQADVLRTIKLAIFDTHMHCALTQTRHHTCHYLTLCVLAYLSPWKLPDGLFFVSNTVPY